MIRIKGLHPRSFLNAYRQGRVAVPQPQHVFVCVADHFEPDWNRADAEQQHRRIQRWVNEYPRAVDGCEDSRGRPPQHTFFTPIECYDPDQIDRLATLVGSGFGDIEFHLHHDDDNENSLRSLLGRSLETFHDRHGLLRKDDSGRIVYGFVHGNWALDNSHPDGRWCGINNEITILRETGCYADFTMPAAPHPAQTRIINRVYYAIDDPRKPKSHDTGPPASCHHPPPADGLLMIQGPLVVSHRKWLGKPKLENGNVSSSQPLASHRIDDWLRAGVVVQGHESWQFIKLHTHGAPENNADVWLGEVAARFHRGLKNAAAGRGFQYYYVTAYEMAKMIGQAEQGFVQPDFHAC